ncbi:hypothetical protein [Bacillus safensis]|uniref:hypothetical protein n=1 Tax=Bacillus safensis TaxID=561879 RepID=UPI003BF5C52F
MEGFLGFRSEEEVLGQGKVQADTQHRRHRRKHIISQYQQALSQPQSMQSLISGQGVGGGHQTVQFAAGCNRRWTIVLLRNGQVFLMFVLSSQPFGRTTGFIWPNFTFGSFPSSSILAYSCA